ncbi:MAG: rhomboid family intramembrane serine protease [Myxococcota bacterium]
MFLPVGDTPNPPNFKPWVNHALLALNVGVFVLVTLPLANQGARADMEGFREYLQALGQRPKSAYDLFIFNNGFKPAAPSLGDLFSSMFLHGGFGHLAGNMLFLWIYGDNVEHYLGRLRYLLSYIATGVAATLTFALFAGNSMVPMVGASGAISGVLGFYFLLFPRNRVKVFVLLFPFFFDVLLIPARVVLGIYLVLDNFIPVLFGAQTGVAYGAHIGGFFGGLAIAFAAERMGWGGRRRKPSAETPRPVFRTPAGAPEAGSQDALEQVRDGLEQGRRGEAVAAALNAGPGRLRALRLREITQLAEWMNELGQRASAMALLRQTLAENQTDPSAMAEIFLALAKMRMEEGQSTAAYQHLMAVLDHAPGSPAAQEAKELLRRHLN